jgi:putative effector of murein hydrolase LrgA (UPF0299 family)
LPSTSSTFIQGRIYLYMNKTFSIGWFLNLKFLFLFLFCRMISIRKIKWIGSFLLHSIIIFFCFAATVACWQCLDMNCATSIFTLKIKIKT